MVVSLDLRPGSAMSLAAPVFQSGRLHHLGWLKPFETLCFPRVFIFVGVTIEVYSWSDWSSVDSQYITIKCNANKWHIVNTNEVFKHLHWSRNQRHSNSIFRWCCSADPICYYKSPPSRSLLLVACHEPMTQCSGKSTFKAFTVPEVWLDVVGCFWFPSPNRPRTLGYRKGPWWMPFWCWPI